MSSSDPPLSVSTSLTRPGVCWECDARTHSLVRAALPLPSGRSVHIDLCADCYEIRYEVLLQELVGDPPERDPRSR